MKQITKGFSQVYIPFAIIGLNFNTLTVGSRPITGSLPVIGCSVDMKGEFFFS